MKSVCFVVSSPITLRAFLLKHIEVLAEIYDVAVVLNLSDDYKLDGLTSRARVICVPIEREIAPFRDLRAFFCLWRLFVREHFDVVHSVTPKAGLLAMTAAWMAGVRNRLHTFTGQVWATEKGMRRCMLKAADRIYAGFASKIYVDSESQRQFLIKEGVLTGNKSKVLASGSISGVDAVRFCPNAQARQRIRASLGIPDNGFVCLFIGRLKKDKGVLDLAKAFARTAADKTDIYIVFVGPDEDHLRGDIESSCAGVSERVSFVDYTYEPESHMAAADVLCLPSYREGFGSVIIEAAAVGVPAVASRIYGITDAVIEGQTGLLHAPGDINGIAQHIMYMFDNVQRRQSMGAEARERVVNHFSDDVVTAALVEEYAVILKGRL